MAIPLLPPYIPYRVRVRWHYGNDIRDYYGEGPFIIDALHDAFKQTGEELPDDHYGPAVESLRRGVAYDGWSWYRIERIAEAN